MADVVSGSFGACIYDYPFATRALVNRSASKTDCSYRAVSKTASVSRNARSNRQLRFPIDLKWKADLGHSTHDYPTYQAGLIFLPADDVLDSSWYSLDAETGQVIWQMKIEDQNFLRCLISEKLVISSWSSFVALDMHTGRLIWKRRWASIASCSQDKVFFSEVPSLLYFSG